MDDIQDLPLKGEMRELQNPAVIEAIGAAVRTYGLKEVARRLRKSPGQLYAELSEFGDQRKAKLSVDDALEASRLTGDVTWLAILAGELGYSLVANHAAPDKPTVAEECNDDLMKLAEFTRVATDDQSTIREVQAASLAARRDISQTETLKLSEIRARQAERKA